MARGTDLLGVCATVTEEVGRLLGADMASMIRFEDGHGTVVAGWSGGSTPAMTIGYRGREPRRPRHDRPGVAAGGVTRTIRGMAGELSDDELAFLHGVIDLAREGNTSELAEMIERGVPVNLTGATGDSLLILAAYHDHPPTVRMLLDHGADPDRINDRGQTALGAAVFRRSVESATLLLDHGADPHAGGRSAAEIAAFFELDDMTALLARSASDRRTS